MKKKTMRVIAVVSALLVLVLSFSGCTNKSEIKKLIENYENACNSLDINEMLECITPEISDKIKMAVGIAGMFSDKDTSELLDSLSSFLMGDSDMGGNDFFSSIKITTNDIEISKEKDKAVVNCIIEYTVKGEEYQKEAVFNCVYHMENWYIHNLDIK